MVDSVPKKPRLYEHAIFVEKNNEFRANRKRFGSGGESIVVSEILVDGEKVEEVAVKYYDMKTPQMQRLYKNDQKWLGVIPDNAQYLIRSIGFGEGISVLEKFGEGDTLADLMNQQNFEPREAIEILQQIGHGLDEIYSLSIGEEKVRYYGDLKPRNCLIRRGNEIRITDGSMINYAPRAIGTLAYMAPERIDNNEDSVGKEIDVFALGVIAFELLTGTHPLIRRSSNAALTSIMWDIYFKDVKPFFLKNQSNNTQATEYDEIKIKLQNIFQKVLAKQPSKRYHDHWAFITDLEEALNSLPEGVTIDNKRILREQQ